jgi:hypothetical protein
MLATTRHRSRPPQARGFVLGWVGVVLILVAIVAGGLHFATSTSRAAVGRAVHAQVYMNLALSALAEALAEVRVSVEEKRALGAIDLYRALGRDFPFEPIEIEPKLTRAMAARLHKSVTVGMVRVGPQSRPPAGWTNPLQGLVELKVQVTGGFGGMKTGREVSQMLVFHVPCSVASLSAFDSTYQRIHWGRPTVVSNPVIMKVIHL